MYDIIIKNGTLIDGAGGTPVIGDIAIKDGVISALGESIESPSELTIDARDKFITPGFIDVTSHSDTTWTLFDYPGQESLITQGVTTILGGNCGASIAPLISPHAIRSIEKWTDISRINTNWQGLGEFLSYLSGRPLGINFGTFIGHGTLRRGLIGDAPRALSPEEMRTMGLLIERSMAEGAFGLSTGLSYAHEAFATIDELSFYAKIIRAKNGVYKTHLRSEGGALIGAVNEAIRIGREAECAVHISHLKAIGKKSWKYIKTLTEMLELAHTNGITVHFDVFPYARTGSLLSQLLPSWARVGGFEKIFHRIKDPIMRERIISALGDLTLHYDRIIIASANAKHIVNKSIQQLAESGGLSPEEALLEILLVNNGRVSIFNKTLSVSRMKMLLEHPLAMIASDGSGYSDAHKKNGDLVHPRSFGTFPHFLHTCARDSQKLTWEKAIEKITSLPATTFGIARRGFLRKNYFADIVVFDPQTIKDTATYKKPFQYAIGLSWVIVNGKIALENGIVNSTRAGAVLKK
ncbi:MAG: hypothetical protein A3I44_01300 [Candidatus Sungbacteria bacterium RIFCSPLOWO2_02_FULL_51_17]|uniref:Amidohydrolase 3 domain-containing protein n=1 Tax=Candidatus Sungbacteria bacterium RIFCSPHIGHO2_02_FULL_51_29 TaxID=1802273 RepID=A0A1G2KS38_9BACT|nr:MAG: hypothetical protein A2676_01005 [Candidatus Sungbacteria bacterium RIFCSPHIGHO2_01_FULL_51_22]OHA02210.1 MAG: hypothetical protein A3C16_00800 [Candidatus Sungbacteria bacterium RIFCSPHIGHO2_02_FULL_51_29]OHA07631.1 MAG: hypothetical protein A3B29_05535 [Candidatus Sungbacteria bacterium RIFCSPLOWO2_01_FULL_51_34]OHA10756.1 MAG: hypothetical protein A3I44_01300 [Candidatus Sungbacteria bacterium RIFCSPLOWO2_02_FULL_51_17]